MQNKHLLLSEIRNKIFQIILGKVRNFFSPWGEDTTESEVAGNVIEEQGEKIEL